MSTGVRLVITAKQQDLISSVKASLERKPYVESVVTVARPADAENKLNRVSLNILLWDLDESTPDQAWTQSLQKRFTLYIIYTSITSSKYTLVPKSGNDEFLPKPAVFTPITAVRYTAAVEKQIDSLARRQHPPATRDLVKMVSPNDKNKIVAVGSSTGGTNALEDLLKRLPDDMPPMVVVQHMPSGFTKLFADRLNAIYKQEIREAQTGDFLMQGRMLLAPADRHMRLVNKHGKIAVECYVGNRIHGVMPAADILFESVAQVMKTNAVGVILTGMGSDGAKGLLQMRNVGCKNIGQDEASCVVYGMPKAARDIGAIDYELPLDKIPDMILRLTRGD